MNINWRERLIAAAIHFLITLAITGAAAAVIFFVWFPGSLATMIGGAKLFLIVVGCDASLGPLISLVIYSSAKSRRQLIVDYSIVGVVQLAALIYGVYVVALSRPVFIAFDLDRLEIVTAIELDNSDLAAGHDPAFRTRSWTGPRLVAIQRPTDIKEKNDLLFLEVSGKRAVFMPKYYRSFATAQDTVKTVSQPLQTLVQRKPQSKAAIENAVNGTGLPDTEINWLLLRHRFGFATVFIDKHSGLPIKYVLVDPS